MSNALSLLGWAFLPNLVTGWAQAIYYGITIRAGDPKPVPNSPRYNLHRRRIHILVVSLYLLYTIYEADYDLQRLGTFYSDLGVPLDATEREIKSRFRRLAAIHHPDKAGDAGSGDAANFFMHLKTASETLLSEPKRFAYDRFGPEIVGWQRCATVRDFVSRGVFSVVLPHYGVAAIAMYVFGMLGYLDFGRYWRWVLLGSMCVLEVQIATRPTPPGFLVSVVNPLLVRFTTHRPYLQWQLVSLARKVCITVYIALSQIGPLLMSQQQAAQKAADGGEEALRQGLERLEGMAAGLDTEAVRLLEMEMAPYAGDRELLASMRHKMKEWLVQNTIRADPMVRDAMGNSFQRRRVDAPAGARGTR